MKLSEQEGMYCMLLTTATFYSILVTTNSEVVSWTVDTTSKPQFNQAVRLNCTVTGATSCCVDETRQWSIFENGGRTIILTDGITSGSYSSKYTEELYLASSQFNLVINNFSLHDFGKIYECAYGFAVDRKMLKSNVTYIPATAEIQILTRDFESSGFSFAVNITAVYPDPSSCLVTYGNSDVSSSLVQTSVPNGDLLSVIMNISEVARECGKAFTIQCTIGPFNEKIIELDPSCQTSCQVADIQRRNIASGKTKMSTDDTSCKAVCPVTVVVTEVVILIVNVIVVYLINDKISSNFRCFVYVCVALNISTITIAGIISGGIVGKFREDGSNGYCCDVDVVVLSAVIPVLTMTFFVGIVSVLLIMKFGKDTIRTNPDKNDTKKPGHDKKASIRDENSDKVSNTNTQRNKNIQKSSKLDKQPPGSRELPTPNIISPTGIIVTPSGKTKLPPIERKNGGANKSENHTNQLTKLSKPFGIHKSEDINELTTNPQQQTLSGNKTHINSEKTTQHTLRDDGKHDKRVSITTDPHANDKHENFSQKKTADKKYDEKNSQTNIKTNEMADEVVHISHQQQQQIKTESKPHNKNESVPNQIQHGIIPNEITSTAIEKKEKQGEANSGKHDQIKRKKKVKQIIQSNETLIIQMTSEVKTSDSTIDKMEDTKGKAAHEQQHPTIETTLHEKPIQNQTNDENMPDKTANLPSNVPIHKNSPDDSQRGTGDRQSDHMQNDRPLHI